MSYRSHCLYCEGHVGEPDTCDVGVGFIQCGPQFCESCGASEIGPYDKERTLTPQEKQTGWYGPGRPAGSSANTINGEIVDHKTAAVAYRMGLLDEKQS